MAYDVPPQGSLKRKRRRREDKSPASGRLYLDSSLKGEHGVLSSDLLEDLFPGSQKSSTSARNQVVYAALTPWSPNPSLAETNWVILPFRASTPHEKQLPPSTVRFPAGALGTQSFVRAVQALSPNRTLRQNSAVEVRVSDVVPLALDTVFVSVDTDALHRLSEMNKKYGGATEGLPSPRKAGRRVMADALVDGIPTEDDDKIKQIVHDALRKVRVAHSDDLVPLPFEHPFTRTPVTPARILAAEPVSQGLIAPTTNVVVVPATERRPASNGNRALLSPRLAEDSGEEETGNETFFSATEDNSPRKPIVISKSATDVSNTDEFDSSAEDSNLSDDSDDMISLEKPGLADIPSGLSSALTSATPRAFSSRIPGISTPGSVFSNMTSMTIRGGQAVRSKVFRAVGLLERISDDLLFPKPAPEEDEEARVYVEASALARLGCFSGDWVKIEAAENHILPSLSAFGSIDALSAQQWRPAKVYTLPESMSKRPQRYQVSTRFARRDSLSSLVANSPAIPTLYASPVLLANLKDPANISMTAMPTNKRASLKRPLVAKPAAASARLPPTASEVTLRKIVSPISTERSLNNALYTNLKHYFEDKRRIVKPGDLLAIQVDESLGRSMYEGEIEPDGSSAGTLLAYMSAPQSNQDSKPAQRIAWFLVEDVNVTSEELDGADAELWADAASIDPTRMTMRQSGDDKRRLPSTTGNTWQYYLGVRKVQTKPASSASAQGIPELAEPYVSNLQRRLRELISVSLSPRAIHLGMPAIAILLTSTQRNIGKSTVIDKTCADLGIHFFPINAHDIASEGGAGIDTQAQGLLEARCERALDCGAEYTCLCITHIEVLNSDRVAASLKSVLERCRVLVATTTDVEKLPDSVRGLFTHELEMSAPDEGEREGILRDIVSNSGTPFSTEVDLSSVAIKTAALVAGDLADVVDRAIVAKAERLEVLAESKSEPARAPVTVKDIQLAGGAAANAVVAADFDAAVELARKNFADAIGAPKIPNVQWSDVGGLTHVKDAVIETIQLPLSRPELFAKGLKKRSGILFYGPPGTGKTLLAKAIATEFSLNFFSVKGPELLNMYIGESEANVRRVFQRARDARPCVVFFDELDSVAPKRGNQGDSGGVMDRIVSQLLAELDGMSDGDEGGGGVFVIGATNRPDLLDQALLRPGRFDKMLYLGISDTHEKQATILQALTRKFTIDPSVSLARISELLPFTFTGADLYALCSDAMLKAVTRSARRVDERIAVINSDRAARGQSKISVPYYFDHFGSAEDTQVTVTTEDFVRAKEELVPSVSMDELRHYERVRDAFEGAQKKDVDNAERQLTVDQNGASGLSPRTIDDLRRLSKSKEAAAAARGVNGGDSLRLKTSQLAAGGSGSGNDAYSDDDYVLRTSRLSVQDTAAPSPIGKGKGKGKARYNPDEAAEPSGDATVPDPDAGASEDLYD